MLTKILNKLGLYTQEQVNAMENYCQALEKRNAKLFDSRADSKTIYKKRYRDALREADMYKRQYENLSASIDGKLKGLGDLDKYLNLPDKQEAIEKSENVILMREKKT